MTIRHNEAGGVIPYPRPPKPRTRRKVVERDGMIIYACSGVDDRGIAWNWFWRDQEGYAPFEYGWAAQKTLEYIFWQDGAIVQRVHRVEGNAMICYTTTWIVDQCRGLPTTVAVINYVEGRVVKAEVSFNEGLALVRELTGDGFEILIPQGKRLPRWEFSRTRTGVGGRFKLSGAKPFICHLGDASRILRGYPCVGEARLLGISVMTETGLFQFDGGTLAVFSMRETEQIDSEDQPTLETTGDQASPTG